MNVVCDFEQTLVDFECEKKKEKSYFWLRFDGQDKRISICINEKQLLELSRVVNDCVSKNLERE